MKFEKDGLIRLQVEKKGVLVETRLIELKSHGVILALGGLILKVGEICQMRLVLLSSSKFWVLSGRVMRIIDQYQSKNEGARRIAELHFESREKERVEEFLTASKNALERGGGGRSL